MKHYKYYFILIYLTIHFTSSDEVLALNKTFNSENIEIQSECSKNNISKSKLSIPKCCDIDEVVIEEKTCEKYSGKLNFATIPLYNDNILKTGRFLPDVYDIEPQGKFRNETFYESAFETHVVKDRYYLSEHGILYRELPNLWKRWYSYNESSFCIDYLKSYSRKNPKKSRLQIRYWIIYQPDRSPPNPTHEFLIKIGLVISCVFLFLTLFVYVLLPELRNLKGLMLMAYLFSLFGLFLFLAILKYFDSMMQSHECKAISYAIYFFFLCSFSWMTIMSFDIWWNFKKSSRGHQVQRLKKREELFKFYMYCLLGYGVPLLMAIAMGVLDNVNMRHLPWFVTPNITWEGCFFERYSIIFYLYVPMFIVTICNWLFFLVTIFYLWRDHRSTRALDVGSAGDRVAHRKLTNRVFLYLKISIVMGINWLLEAISALQPDLDLWLISDLYNAFTGVSIFLIHTFKRDILRKLKRRFRGVSNTEETSRQQYSTASRSTNDSSSETEETQEAPLVCPNPSGPNHLMKTRNI